MPEGLKAISLKTPNAIFGKKLCIDKVHQFQAQLSLVFILVTEERLVTCARTIIYHMGCSE